MKKRILIVGSGYAGMTLAYEAVKKDFAVTLVDAKREVATLASSHSAAVTFPTLSAVQTRLSSISLLGKSQLTPLLEEIDCPYRQTGLLKIALHKKEVLRWSRFIENHAVSGDDFQILSPAACEKERGIGFQEPALWMPWVRLLSLKDFCERVKAKINSSIEIKTQWRLQEFAESAHEVVAQSESGDSLRADFMILACPQFLKSLPFAKNKALREMQGRVIDIHFSQDRFDLPFILNFKRHLGPRDAEGTRSLGATLERMEVKEGQQVKESGAPLQSENEAATELVTDLKRFLKTDDLEVAIRKIWTASRFTRAGQEPLCDRLDESQRIFAFSGFGSKAALSVAALAPRLIQMLR